MANILPERFVRLRELRGLTQQEMGNILGVTAKYVGMIERGVKPVEEGSSLGLLFRSQEDGHTHITIAPSENSAADGLRLIPVIGWAHAGEAESYEQIPTDWQNRIPTECHDPRAFAVFLEGDSMEPKFSDGDVLVVQPSEEPYSGCFVVARFKDDGVIFRRMEMSGSNVILKPLNDRWPVTSHTVQDFSWIYPVWGRWTPIWKRR